MKTLVILMVADINNLMMQNIWWTKKSSKIAFVDQKLFFLILSVKAMHNIDASVYSVANNICKKFNEGLECQWGLICKQLRAKNAT